MTELPVPLGIIEGYFGRPWSWEDREAVAAALAPHGYAFFWYAPKADAFLRRRWTEPLPLEHARALGRFAESCHANGLTFGVGLSPYEAWTHFDAAARASLKAKIADLDALGLDALCILFDDMRGDVPDLARRQIEIAHEAAGMTQAKGLVLCPTYYTDHPVLDRVFGRRPANYLQELGEGLDPAFDLFWTGEKVCSPSYSPEHLADVAARLGRKPLLWDNYPVNDGPRMSPFLHLRAMTGRPASNAERIAAHAVNPALQPHLSLIPLLSLAWSYAAGDEAYDPEAAFDQAAALIGDDRLAARLKADLGTFQDVGREKLSDADLADLAARYAAFDHPAAREVVAWADGGYVVDADTALT